MEGLHCLGMEYQESSPKKKRSNWNWMCSLFIIVSALFIAWPFITWGILGIADSLFEGINFPETSRFGISGDMYGALNALFAGFAFICFIYALYQQRLELQLQRRELSLQRRELKAQCKEQERQANEFEIQNKLAKNQQFQSIFYQQIFLIKSLQDDIKIYDRCGKFAIEIMHDNWRKISNNIAMVVCGIRNRKNYAINLNNLPVSGEYAYKSLPNNPIGSWDVFGEQINNIRPWIDSVYYLFLLVINEKSLNFNQKDKYLHIIKNSVWNKHWEIIHVVGRFLNYNKIIDFLLDKKIFDEEESIEKVVEEHKQILQNEIKLKSNPSLESCEIPV